MRDPGKASSEGVGSREQRIGNKTTRRAAMLVAMTGIAGASLASAQSSGDWRPAKQAAGLRSGKASNEGALLSECIRSGHLLFTSGIGGWYPDRRKEPGDATVQMRSALQMMKERLEAAGSSLDNVLRVHVALVDPETNFDLMNIAYREFFSQVPPARSFWGSTGFRRKGVLLQVDCIAYVN
jgi:enamine deaminase RidA (YjgF/YER057c/UK114 family)